MAQLLSMSPVTYIKCEEPKHAGQMWANTAEKLGRFYWLAELTLLDLEHVDIHLDQLMSMPMVASMSGIPPEVLMKWHRDGVIATEDLGILGLWVYRTDLEHIGEARAPR
jgi:hypothetical protein